MFQNLNFRYDNIDSESMDLVVVTVDGSGLMSQAIGYSQQPIEEKFRTIDEPFFYGVERTPITFDLTFTTLNRNIVWDNERRAEIVSWLFQNDYKTFTSEDNDHQKIYMIMAVSDPKLFVNGINDGYATITFKMMTPYAYSHKILSKYTITQTNNKINLTNLSDINGRDYYPIFEFTLTGGATSIIFRNLTTGKELSFTGLNVGEVIYVDNKRGEIISSTNQPRIDECNRKWLALKRGLNKIEIITNNNGGCNLTVEMQFPMSM